MHREAFIEKLTEIQQNVEQLLAQLQASEHDKFAAHLYRSRREYRSACQRAGKSGKQIERGVISTFQLPGASDSRVTFANGSSCCRLAIDHRFALAIQISEWGIE